MLSRCHATLLSDACDPTAALPALLGHRPTRASHAVKELPSTKAIDKLVKGGGKDGEGLRLQSE